MTSNKTTRRALFGSLMSLLLCCSMLVGTTFAWFTDTVTSTGNIIKSGTLDVEMYYGDSLADVVNETYDAAEGAIFNYKYWEPGYTEVKYLKVKNVGDLAFRYNLYIEPDFTGATTDAEKANLVKLAEALDVYCAIVPDNSYAHPTSLADLASLGTLEYRMGLEEGVDTGVILPVSGAADVDRAAAGNEIYEGEVTVCMALHMQEEAGNDYQNLTLGNGFAVKLLASQVSYEKDEFGADYDKNSVSAATGSVAIDGATTTYYVDVMSYEGEGTATGKVATAEIPAAAVDTNANAVVISVTPTTLNPEVAIAADQGGKSFDIEVTGLNNNEDIKMMLYVGTGLTGVKLYHYGTEVPGAVYSPDGYITFWASDFSPYTVVFDAEPVIVPPATDVDNLKDKFDGPVNMPDFENTSLTWKPYEYAGYRFYPSDPAQMLEKAYQYKAPHTYEDVEDSGYADWYCDYEVSIDRDIEAGSIFLAGNYGRYGWVGFENPEAVAAGVKTKLISSVLSASTPWTYAEVVGLVQTFNCGVAQANGSTEDLTGATFTVELCVYHPTTGDRFVVNTTTHTFQ